MENSLMYKFGPCGLLCEKCFAFDKGPVKHYAEHLKNYLGAFDNYAKRFTVLLDEPVFGKYPEFRELLTLFSEGKCKGCRLQECQLFKNCNVKACYKEKEVDFCFECQSFPCSDTGFDENLEKRWISINQRIREVGLETYYNEIKDKPRY